MCSRIDVQFRSDHLLQYAGFKLTYRVKKVSDTASNGTFDLENYIHILWEFEKSALKLLSSDTFQKMSPRLLADHKNQVTES